MPNTSRVITSLKMPLVACVLALGLLVLAFAAPKESTAPFENPWSKGRFALLQALALPKSNTETPQNTALITLGQTLFYDSSLNPDTGRACVSCHLPSLAFSDGQQHPAGNPQKRNAPGLFGASSHRWQFWDGRSDSLWSQVFGPLYSGHEIGLSPEQLLSTFDSSTRYRYLFEAAIGPWPESLPRASSSAGQELQAQIALALEAFVAQLRFQTTSYDRYIYALQAENAADADLWLDEQQRAGIEVFLRSNCLSCHRGSNFSDGNFHNIGTGESDPGRAAGLELWKSNNYNCQSETAKSIGRTCDNNPVMHVEIPRLLDGAFKTPSLRELTHTAPYMHDGRYQSIEEVIEHYRNPPTSEHGLSQIQAISDLEAAQLAAFLESLSSPIQPDVWYNKPPDFLIEP